LYEDPWVQCGREALTIRGYYFPFATPKVIAYRDIQSVTPFELGPWTGKWRIWGTSNPSQWWHLDWSRPQKQVALVLDLGGPVRPVITPADPEQVKAIIDEQCRFPRTPFV
jgi:hypothetical protein